LDNIIKFPKQNLRSADQISADLELNAKVMKHKEIDEICLYMVDVILDELEIFGYSSSFIQETNIKDFTMVLEAVKSLLKKTNNQEYYLQHITEKLFSLKNDSIEINKNEFN